MQARKRKSEKNQNEPKRERKPELRNDKETLLVDALSGRCSGRNRCETQVFWKNFGEVDHKK